MAIATTILNWGNRKTVPAITDATIEHELRTTDFARRDFISPIWIDNNPVYEKHRPSGPQLDLLFGKADIKELLIHPTKHEYVLNAHTDVQLKDNTFYFPGWQVIANNNPVPINLHDQTYPGSIVFTLKKGTYKILVEFVDTPVRKVGKYITYTSILFISLLLFIKMVNKPGLKKLLRKLN